MLRTNKPQTSKNQSFTIKILTMTKLQNFFKNPFNKQFETVKENGQNEINNRTTQQANEIFKDKPFALEYKTAFIIAKCISFVANIVSLFSAFFAIQFILSLLTGVYIAFFGSLAICGLLELLKNASWKVNIKNFLRYKKVNIGLFLLIVLSLASIGTSLLGAYLIPNSFVSSPVKNNSDSLALADLTTINTQIANLDKLVLETSNKAIPNQQGKVSSTFKTMLASLTVQKDSLSSEKRAINKRLESIRAEQATDKENANKGEIENIKFLQICCVLVALAFEVIFILCTIFTFYYMFRVYVDTGEQPKTVQTIVNTGELPTQRNGNERQTIGFFNENRTTNENRINCKNCSKEFTKNHKKQIFCAEKCRISHWNKTHERTINEKGF